MLLKWDIEFPGAGEYSARRAYINLPDNYEEEPDTCYPVLYMFDGHNIFLDSDATYGKSWGMKDYLEFTERQIIVVGVECNHSPDHGRLREYSPFTFQDPKFGRIPGLAKDTMDWLVAVFKPFIDENFRTIPDREHTFVAGSSMGGLISLYAVIAYNQFFSGAACLSPSIWTNMTQINRMIEDAEIDPYTTIYMDYGQNEINFHKVMRKQFRKVCDLLMKRHVMLTSRIVPNGDHCEACWEKQIPFFMDTLLYPLEMAEYRRFDDGIEE